MKHSTNSSELFLTPQSKFVTGLIQDAIIPPPHQQKQVAPPRSYPWSEEIEDKYNEIPECPVFRPTLEEFQMKSFQ